MDNREQNLPEDQLPEEDHFLGALNTPLRADAFALSDDQKMDGIEEHFRQIMLLLGLDLDDDSLKGTPRRVAKMYVKEIFNGLKPENKPTARLFENRYGYRQMLVERNITLYSNCEHHFVPIIGKAHVAYIPEGHVIGLSKLNRIVQYYGRRPQVQERLTRQIAQEMRNVLHTQNVAVLIEADHLCVMSRGVNDVNSSTITSDFSGLFEQDSVRLEFMQAIRNNI